MASTPSASASPPERASAHVVRRQHHAVAERLCEVIEDQPFRLASGEELRVTVSIGVAVAGGEASYAVEGLVEQADLALLESKGAGRNQVTFRMNAA